MHVLFVHQNYPAQFGHVADYLAARHGFRCTFVSERPPARAGGVERIQYSIRGGATPSTHYCSRTFENAVWHTHAVYEALKARPDVRPDLVVGHSGFGSTLFLRELYDRPLINYFEYFYRPKNSDMDFRPDFPTNELDRLRARARNAMLLARPGELRQGLQPTRWQRDRLPPSSTTRSASSSTASTLSSGAPTPPPGSSAGWATSPSPRHARRHLRHPRHGVDARLDVFMKMARGLCQRRKDVVFLIAGQDRVCYAATRRSPAASRSRTGCCPATTTTCRASCSWGCCRRPSWPGCSPSATCTST